MQTITIANPYYSWVSEKVPAAFHKLGVEVTEPALSILAQMLQSQRQEGLVRDDAALLEKADQFLTIATRTYARMYGAEPMNINRALHLVVNINRLYAVFPWGTTD